MPKTFADFYDMKYSNEEAFQRLVEEYRKTKKEQ